MEEGNNEDCKFKMEGKKRKRGKIQRQRRKEEKNGKKDIRRKVD